MAKAYFHAKSEKGLLTFSNKREVMEWLMQNDMKTLLVSIERATGVRTFSQNNALHKYYELLADALNDAGLTVKAVLEKKMELNWTPNMIKELLWRDVQKRLYGKESTADLDKVKEIDNIHEHLTRHLAQIFNLPPIEFPNDPNKRK